LEQIAMLDKGNLNVWLMLGDVFLKSNPPELNMAYAAYREALSLYPEDKSLALKEKLLRDRLR
jgi:cytochrome c-type biogenesis protein CcmH/NrfG